MLISYFLVTVKPNDEEEKNLCVGNRCVSPTDEYSTFTKKGITLLYGPSSDSGSPPEILDLLVQTLGGRQRLMLGFGP